MITQLLLEFANEHMSKLDEFELESCGSNHMSHRCKCTNFILNMVVDGDDFVVISGPHRKCTDPILTVPTVRTTRHELCDPGLLDSILLSICDAIVDHKMSTFPDTHHG